MGLTHGRMFGARLGARPWVLVVVVNFQHAHSISIAKMKILGWDLEFDQNMEVV